jgi:hypothetical protein
MDAIAISRKLKTLELPNRDGRVRSMVDALTIDERDAIMSGDTATLLARIST